MSRASSANAATKRDETNVADGDNGDNGDDREDDANGESSRAIYDPTGHSVTPMRSDDKARSAAERQANNRPINDVSEHNATKAQLANQEKIMISLPQRPPNEQPLPKKFVGYNGYNFLVPRGVPVNVPIGVYEILVASGDLPPMRQEDVSLKPSRTWLPLGSGGHDSYISQQQPIDLVPTTGW